MRIALRIQMEDGSRWEGRGAKHANLLCKDGKEGTYCISQFQHCSSRNQSLFVVILNVDVNNMNWSIQFSASSEKIYFSVSKPTNIYEEG